MPLTTQRSENADTHRCILETYTNAWRLPPGDRRYTFLDLYLLEVCARTQHTSCCLKINSHSVIHLCKVFAMPEVCCVCAHTQHTSRSLKTNPLIFYHCSHSVIHLCKSIRYIEALRWLYHLNLRHDYRNHLWICRCRYIESCVGTTFRCGWPCMENGLCV